jgi:cellobiose phosphorylase
MMPINNSANSDRYKVEPYVYAEYVTSPEHPTAGEASHSWLTGSAVWMLRNATDALLGLRPTYEGLRLDPHLPREWKHVRVRRVFRGTTYGIEMEQVSAVERKCELYIDGEPWTDSLLPQSQGVTIQVRVRLGLPEAEFEKA